MTLLFFSFASLSIFCFSVLSGASDNLSVSDFQGLIAEDGQLYIIDPMGIVMSPQNTKRNTDQLDALQTFEHYILERHNLFTDKTLDHIVYIDKQLWDAPDKTLKQKILSDAKEKNNKVIVVYDSATKSRYLFFKSALGIILSRLITSTVAKSKL
jgi:hypothetical protein